MLDLVPPFAPGDMDSSGSEGILGVVLRRSETAGRGLGLGFSIIGGIGYDFPPVLYDIEKDSPAEICGMVSILIVSYCLVFFIWGDYKAGLVVLTSGGFKHFRN